MRDHVVGEAINIGNATHKSVADIAKLVVKAMGKPEDLITYTGDRPGQVFRHTCDAGKAKSLLGWEPQVGWEEGLGHTIKWYIDNEAWWRPQMWMRNIPIVTLGGKRELH